MNQSTDRPASGFTLIEFLIGVAMMAIVLAMAIPALSHYSLKAIISESLSITSSAKSAIIYACQKNPDLDEVSGQTVGYFFGSSKYVYEVELDGDCNTPTITIILQATGTQPDPVLTITGDFTRETGRMSWFCESDKPELPLPDSC